MSVVQYGSDAKTVAIFTDNDFINKLESVTLLRQPRRIDKAIQHTVRLINDTESEGPVLVVLLTAGRQAPAFNSIRFHDVVKPLRMSHAQTYVLAIGRRASRSYLSPLVLKDEDIFMIKKFDYLPVMAKSIAMKIRSQFGKKNLVSQ